VPRNFLVWDAAGSVPVPTVAADQNGSLFRAHTSLSEAQEGTENTGMDMHRHPFLEEP